ncbi:large subunit ribosomal protein L32 [Desulfosalsimonas propionicica]|uniref:Large ribosomal subunit protein bL32 n=1 Tax=Desulfosalsimonas propionicica TaxID=332175 RepID=A0A7W0C6Y9_9BACT|nr:50S ribosomal protein L32 [Desulfosalsimonas propionicica]MBA2880314.1 large subunit ribosomal protein L32 [Desulfosalsimonas propionicica]
MAVPKHKVSRSKRDKRRTHQKAQAPALSRCTQCGETVMSHRACPECGNYKGRTVIETEA